MPEERGTTHNGVTRIIGRSHGTSPELVRDTPRGPANRFRSGAGDRVSRCREGESAVRPGVSDGVPLPAPARGAASSGGDRRSPGPVPPGIRAPASGSPSVREPVREPLYRTPFPGSAAPLVAFPEISFRTPLSGVAAPLTFRATLSLPATERGGEYEPRPGMSPLDHAPSGGTGAAGLTAPVLHGREHCRDTRRGTSPPTPPGPDGRKGMKEQVKGVWDVVVHIWALTARAPSAGPDGSAYRQCHIASPPPVIPCDHDITLI
jgi:hypothetical protein